MSGKKTFWLTRKNSVRSHIINKLPWRIDFVERNLWLFMALCRPWQLMTMGNPIANFAFLGRSFLRPGKPSRLIKYQFEAHQSGNNKGTKEITNKVVLFEEYPE